MDKKGKGVSRYSVENFLCHSAEKFRKRILYCCIKFVQRKSLWTRRGREYQDIPWKIFCVTVPKNSVGESFAFALKSCIEKVWIRGGGSIKIFCRIFFVSQCRNIR